MPRFFDATSPVELKRRQLIECMNRFNIYKLNRDERNCFPILRLHVRNRVIADLHLCWPSNSKFTQLLTIVEYRKESVKATTGLR
jgi:hypothetical protein